MPRRGFVPKREVLPDPVYGTTIVTKLINQIMLDGKRGIAQSVCYDAFQMLADKTGKDAMEVFNAGLQNILPSLEVKARRVGGATYQVPLEVRPERRQTLALRWLVMFARKRGERDIDSFKQCMRVLKAGEKLIVFPEGTRVHGDAVVEPKSGVIHMSVRLHVPIVPVFIPRDKKVFRKVPTVIGEPYYPEVGDHRDYDRLARELMGRIWALKPEE